MVTVFVGEEQAKFDLYRSYLRRNSTFFRAKLDDDWSGSEQGIHVPELDPGLFEIFARWLNEGHIRSLKRVEDNISCDDVRDVKAKAAQREGQRDLQEASNGSNLNSGGGEHGCPTRPSVAAASAGIAQTKGKRQTCTHYSIGTLRKLYWLAGKLQSPSLRNLIIDVTVDLLKTHRSRPSAVFVTEVYEFAPKSAKLRDLLVDVHVYEKIYNKIYNKDEYPGEFTWAIIKKIDHINEKRRKITPRRAPYNKDVCGTYHEPTNGAAKCGCGKKKV